MPELPRDTSTWNLDRTHLCVPRFMVLLGLAQLDAMGERATTRAILAATVVPEPDEADAPPPGYLLRATRTAIRDLAERGWIGRAGQELWLTREGWSVLSIALVCHQWFGHMDREEEEP